MPDSHRSLLVVLLVTFSTTLTGCTTAIKQVYHEVRGAKSEVMLVRNVSENAIAPYQDVQFDAVTTSVGSKICPPSLLAAYNEAAAVRRDRLREAYPGGSPALRITSDLIYFQEKGLLSGAVLLARVKLHDRDDNRVVVDTLVRTESKSFRKGGGGDLAESNVRAIGKMLEGRKIVEDEGILQEIFD